LKNRLPLIVSLFVLSACDGGDATDFFLVEGHAMSPTLEDGDLVEVLDYSGEAPARGDVVVFAMPIHPERIFIKRIIALPGETIEIDGASGAVLVNGAMLDEPYVQGATDCLPNACSWTVPGAQGERSISEEDYEPRRGPSPLGEEDEGCAIGGCYFVLGDYRQNSSDSRQGWLVPAENIAGFVEID
jgi:signal peptidase I